MDWKPNFTIHPHGFSFVMKPGTYVIGDILLLREDVSLKNGFWVETNTNKQVCILKTGAGYYKIYDSIQIFKHVTDKILAIMEVDSTINLMNVSSFQFTSVSEIKVRVNEELKKIDIKFDSQHILVDFIGFEEDD